MSEKLYNCKCTKCEYKKNFTGQHGTLYVFDVAFDCESNGRTIEKTGDYSGIDKNNPKFKIGETYAIEVFPDESGKNYPSKIKPLDTKDQNSYRGQQRGIRDAFDPKENHRIALQVAMECAIDTLLLLEPDKVLKGHDSVLCLKFVEWLDKIGVDRNTSIMSSNALRRAVKCVSMANLMDDSTKLSLSEKIINKATEILTFYQQK